MAPSLFVAGSTGLQTEFYQLVQAAVYHADGLWGEATFDLYLKELPPGHDFVVAAGIGPAIAAALAMRFSETEVAWLRQHPAFAKISDYFFAELRGFAFSGDIDAVPEGTPLFPGEPLLRVTAPLQQAGLVEIRLMQGIAQASGVATRAAEMVRAAGGRPVLDFGSRRCPSPESAWNATRAAFIGGCSGTTNALAAHTLNIPSIGVISESMLAAYEDPSSAYEVLRLHFPNGCHVNLPAGPVESAVARLRPIQDSLRTVRLDADDLLPTSLALRQALDAAGLKRVRILGSGSLAPEDIAGLVERKAPIDAFGVGAALTLGRPAFTPRLSYRMSEMVRGTEPEPLTSPWAAPWPGRKQVVRLPDRDVIALEAEADALAAAGGELLLRPAVRAGELVGAPETLNALRVRCQRQLALIAPTLPGRPVGPSAGLAAVAAR